MSPNISPRYSIIRVAMLFLALSHPAWRLGAAEAAASSLEVKRDGLHTWVERPWDMRYFIQIIGEGPPWSSRKDGAMKRNARPGTTFFDWEEFMDPAYKLKLVDSQSFDPTGFNVVLIEFDKEGFVTTKNTHPTPLRGRLNRLQSLVLSAGDGPRDRTYHLAIWFTGIGDASTHWAPAFCNTDQQPDPAMVRSDGYLYGKYYKADEFSTTFGCREWAYQLYDDQRPYIDVTSYVPKGKTFPSGTYIRDFIGWARFGDKKPVIGKHEDTWYCLHDCPGGAQPGAIPDIKAWATDNGWPVPKPPTKAPTFVDPPAQPGTYPH